MKRCHAELVSASIKRRLARQYFLKTEVLPPLIAAWMDAETRSA
jgi:hypothetical protein